jgi:MFS family permease
MGLATVWQGVFAARLLDRLGAGARSAPRDALIASSVDEDNRGRAFGLEGAGDNAGAFLGPLLAALLLYALRLDMRSIFFLAVIPGLLAFMMVLLVKEKGAALAAKSKLDIRVRQFPTDYWKYLLATALFGIGNSSNAFLILRSQDVGASLETTILGQGIGPTCRCGIYAGDRSTAERSDDNRHDADRRSEGRSG